MAPTKRKPTTPKLTIRKAAVRVSRTPASIHELEISLCEVEPRIWRRFAVRSNITLTKLHDVVQIVMGWMNSHLHQFVTHDETHYAPLSPYGDSDWDERVSNSAKVRVQDVLPARGAQLLYLYDFGDDWLHELKVIRIGPPEGSTRCARCLAGDRACPPEDVGGIPGFYQMLEALADPRHEEHDSYIEWLGRKFEPEAFDLDAVNWALARRR